ncbi:MAG: hypothetical protein ABSH22_04950 [Tepidisphaeraceae bacterium]|jgi:hypothetical protein
MQTKDVPRKTGAAAAEEAFIRSIARAIDKTRRALVAGGVDEPTVWMAARRSIMTLHDAAADVECADFPVLTLGERFSN